MLSICGKIGQGATAGLYVPRHSHALWPDAAQHEVLMSTPFSRSMRSLSADSARRSLAGLFIAITLLIAWTVWFCLARVTLYEVTTTARLEVNRAAHPVAVPVAGRIVVTRLVLGQE